jgi:hypothetical protein
MTNERLVLAVRALVNTTYVEGVPRVVCGTVVYLLIAEPHDTSPTCTAKASPDVSEVVRSTNA